MQNLFVVMRRYGPPYSPGRPLEEQQDWEAHRAFMNALEAEGVVRLGGPFEEREMCFWSSERTTKGKSNAISPMIPGQGPASSRPREFRVGSCGSEK